jgi:hypothetical protein
MHGLPRNSAILASSRTTRAPEIDVSTVNAKHSRVKSSTATKIRKRLPSASTSCRKSIDQRWFVRDRHGRPSADRPLAPAAPADSQPFLAVEPEQLLVVDLHAFPSQQQVLPPVAEAAARVRNLAQPASQHAVVRPGGDMAVVFGAIPTKAQARRCE